MKTRKYPPDWDSPKWEDAIVVELEPWGSFPNACLVFRSEKTGQKGFVDLTTCFDPIPDIIAWLDHLSQGREPRPVYVDEEGWDVRIWGRRAENNSSEGPLIELREEEVFCLGDGWPEYTDDEVPIKKTILLIRTPLRSFVRSLKRVLLSLVSEKRMEVKRSETGLIASDPCSGGSNWGKCWKDVIARLDEIETE